MRPSESVIFTSPMRLGSRPWLFLFMRQWIKGGLIDAGSHDLVTFEEMGIPNWVIEDGLCPGLPNWEALKSPDCAKNFATADSGGKGRWLEGPVEWHGDVMPNRLKVSRA